MILNSLEITGFVFGVAGVWLTIRKNGWCFPVGLVNVLITAWLVGNQQLYADVMQQLVYCMLLVYGWIRWSTGKTKTKQRITTSSLSNKLLLIVIIVSGSLVLGYLLKSFSGASFPYLDSTGTIICFIAQWLVALKKIENWHLWIVANLLYIYIYWMKELPLYAGLSFIYLVMAIIGLLQWTRIRKTEIHD